MSNDKESKGKSPSDAKEKAAFNEIARISFYNAQVNARKALHFDYGIVMEAFYKKDKTAWLAINALNDEARNIFRNLIAQIAEIENKGSYSEVGGELEVNSR